MALEYCKKLRSRMKLQEVENTLRQELLDLMHSHEITRCEVDGTVVFIKPGEDKIKIEKLKDD